MFEKEIMNKNVVELYDNQLHLLICGVITGFKSKFGYIIIDHHVLFPVSHIAKIAVQYNNNIQEIR